jgi:hypothetical protein
MGANSCTTGLVGKGQLNVVQPDGATTHATVARTH